MEASFELPCTISFVELKRRLRRGIEAQIQKKVTSILYRQPVLLFGGLQQFQAVPVTDEAKMYEIFSMYEQNQAQASILELYVYFDKLAGEKGKDMELEEYSSESEEEFEANYEIAVNVNEVRFDNPMALKKRLSFMCSQKAADGESQDDRLIK
ncbi:hypothetical protein PIB30_023904 [Stylosanthes scabra]|uniref:Uncharacterized protein n=1 Tax=Stylosanthes scabra TaxID=79078 RepID=A0ABU6UCX6_9FABA|nr:hypothetical protein [Stylosanthes scabra]